MSWFWLAIPAWYALASLASFALYALDKHKAGRMAWRISEATLLRIDLLGGWPGGRLAQQALRHKRAKPAYMRKFWAIVALHVLLWIAIGAWLIAR